MDLPETFRGKLKEEFIMKKALSLLAIVSMLLVILFCITGCSSVEGRYVCKIEGIVFTEMTFEDDAVTSYNPKTGSTKTGTFTLEENNLRVEWSDGKSDEFIYDEDAETLTSKLMDTLVWVKE